MNRLYLTLIKGSWLLAIWLWAGAVQAQDLLPADFAYGIRVDTIGQQPVQAFVLPAAVYEHLTRDDLGDLRIFNGDGKAVPHALHYVAETPEAIAQTASLPFFPVHGDAQRSLGDLGIQVQRTRAGTLVKIDEQAQARQQVLRAYIVDASQLKKSVNKLTFKWQSPPENLLVNVNIETSNDLVSWRPWGGRHTLTSMRHNESVLVKNTIGLPAQASNYYRISWQQTAAFPPIDQLEVTTAPDRPEHNRHWTSIVLEEEKKGVFTGSIPGAIPADRIEIELPDAQTIVRLTVESSMTGDNPWAHQYAGLAYNLQAGAEQWRSEPISIYRNTHHFWRLTVDEDASGLLLGAPSLRFGWTPASVLFVPQGSPPYTLAFGNAEAKSAGFRSAELFKPVAQNFDTVFDLPVATLGVVSELGGEARLRQPTQISWERFVLWGSMILGVTVLGLMALRLMRKPAE